MGLVGKPKEQKTTTHHILQITLTSAAAAAKVCHISHKSIVCLFKGTEVVLLYCIILTFTCM